MSEKTLLCIFGVIPRSIKHTYECIEQMIISPLRKEFDLDIFCFNMNIGDVPVDDVKINQDDSI